MQFCLKMKKEINNKSSLVVYLPANFDADRILENEKMNVTKRANIKAAMYFILNSLYEISLQRRYRDTFEEVGGYPLSSKIINDVLGKRYVEALHLLEKHSVITRSDGYQVSIQSKIVCLTEQYASAGIKIRQIPSNATIAAKITSSKIKIETDNKTALGKIPFVTKCVSWPKI